MLSGCVLAHEQFFSGEAHRVIDLNLWLLLRIALSTAHELGFSKVVWTLLRNAGEVRERFLNFGYRVLLRIIFALVEASLGI